MPDEKAKQEKGECKTMEERDSRVAFIATPIGPVNSEIRRATDGLLASVIRPVLENFGFECVASHEESDQGSISQRMIEHLLDDELVVVNLTGLNANVMYELGIRHSTGKPVILICENNTNLPFDMYDQRTVFYTDDMQGVMELRNGLEAVLSDSELYESNKYNPVISKARDNVIEKAIQGMDFSKVDEGSIAAELYDSVVNMSSSISHIARRMERLEAGVPNPHVHSHTHGSVVKSNKTPGGASNHTSSLCRISVSSENEFDLLAHQFIANGVNYTAMKDKRGFDFDVENYELARKVISELV